MARAAQLSDHQPKRDVHDWLSVEYVAEWVDDWDARPERPAQLRRIAVALPFGRNEPIRVLDVGGGWGPVTEQVLAYRPNASVTLVDFSQPMLDQAQGRLAEKGMSAEFVQRDLTDEGWTAGLDAPYDAVVSCLAIHNLHEPDVIQRVYADIFELVRAGGCFYNLETIFSVGPRLGGIAKRLRADARGGDPESIDLPETGFRAPDAAPTPVPPQSLESQLEWLRNAGFAEVDCLWREANLALLAALKS